MHENRQEPTARFQSKSLSSQKVTKMAEQSQRRGSHGDRTQIDGYGSTEVHQYCLLQAIDPIDTGVHVR